MCIYKGSVEQDVVETLSPLLSMLGISLSACGHILTLVRAPVPSSSEFSRIKVDFVYDQNYRQNYVDYYHPRIA